MANTETRKVDTGIIQRGKTYRFTVYLGYDDKGKQIRQTITFTPPTGLTQRKADKLAKEEYIDFSNRCKGLCNLKENMRFSELIEEYFRLYVPNNLKPITAYNYEKHINYHFKIKPFTRAGNICCNRFSPIYSFIHFVSACIHTHSRICRHVKMHLSI